MNAAARSLVILAGGRSRRLGLNKTLVPIRGRSTLSRILAATSDIGDAVLAVREVWPFAVALEQEGWEPVVGGEDRPRLSVSLRGPGDRRLLIVPDPQPDLGPVAGVVSGLSIARGRISVVLAGDLPFVTTRFVDRLTESLAQDLELDAIVPFVGGRVQPLSSAYRTEVREIAREILEQSVKVGQPASMMQLLKRLSVRYVGVDALSDVGDLQAITRGIDRPEDLDWAVRHAAEVD